jgi:ferrous iron transport protein B
MGIQRDNWPASVAFVSGVFAKEAVVGTLNALYSQIGYERDEESFSPAPGLVDALRSIPENLSAVGGMVLDPLGLRAAGEPEAAGVEQRGLQRTLSARFGSRALAYAYLLFILIYFPCFAATVTMAQEIGVAYALFNALYLTVLGWIVGTFFYQVAEGREPLWIAVPVALTLLIVLGMILAGGRTRVHGAEEQGSVEDR